MITFLDCTLRDGGYYNAWDFSMDLVEEYLEVMQASEVDVVELGFRTMKNDGFLGPYAFTTDDFIRTLQIPEGLTIGVMVNGSELVGTVSQHEALNCLFPHAAEDSPVDLVRIACHVHEFAQALPAVNFLKERGYMVGFNLMQVSDRTEDEIKALAQEAKGYPIDVLYFADSLGGMTPQQTTQIIRWFRAEWVGPIGIHTHDNMGLSLSNTLHALEEGVTWVDSTVTGMGRGPGNARTEELAIEIAQRRGVKVNMVPLMQLLREHFKSMQAQYGWGTNPYYYLAGKYSIHPSYIQQMLNDSRYDDEDVIAVIDHLRIKGGKKFSLNTLDAARHFYRDKPKGKWSPREIFSEREVLILGTGPGVQKHKSAIERYIKIKDPLVLALNTQTGIDANLIDLRVACHPVRLLADCDTHTKLPQPLITPFSMLPKDVQSALSGKEILDFGFHIESERFAFNDYYCTLPNSLVIAYALAIATSGQAVQILMAGFDGYLSDDPRFKEMMKLIEYYKSEASSLELRAITPTRYDIKTVSVYGMI